MAYSHFRQRHPYLFVNLWFLPTLCSKLQYVGGPPNGSFEKTGGIDIKYPQEQSFQKLKAALCQASTLAYPDVTRTFVVHLDACNVAMGATLSQEDASGQLCLLNCASRKFNFAERNYPTHEREMMAMVLLSSTGNIT